MRVVVHAEDLSGRKDDGYYTKASIDLALDLFFRHDDNKNYLDREGSFQITKEEAREMFVIDRLVVFYNELGEKTVITADPDQ